jgi:hypothetical protein
VLYTSHDCHHTVKSTATQTRLDISFVTCQPVQPTIVKSTMNSKRLLETDHAETRDSPQYTPKRPKTSTFNAFAIKKMGYTFELSETIALLRSRLRDPWKLGFAVGVMLDRISPLLSAHLDNAVDFQNPVPRTLACLPGFVSAIDQYIAYLRLTDGCAQKFPDDLDVDRKGRKPRRRYMDRYTYMVESAYKDHICDSFGYIFRSWDTQQTQLFNKGIDKALSGTQWIVYPDKNVVIEAGEGDWAVWLRGRCEELGMAEAKAGRRVLEDM